MADSLDQITPLILTYNEEANLSRTLAGLSWARRIVVIDSFSTDATLPLLAKHSQVEVVQRAFDTHATQWNMGLDLIPEGWLLSMDADYVLTPALQQEIGEAVESADQLRVDGYRIPFLYCVFGRPLHGTVLPPRLALFRRSCGTYVDDGHTQDLRLSGNCAALSSPILHDDLNTSPSQLGTADRLRRHTVLAPFAVLLLCLIWHRGLLDGWRGRFYAFQRMYVETLLSLMLLEARNGG